MSYISLSVGEAVCASVLIVNVGSPSGASAPAKAKITRKRQCHAEILQFYIVFLTNYT
jgi:hypothetical protein